MVQILQRLIFYVKILLIKTANEYASHFNFNKIINLQ